MLGGRPIGRTSDSESDYPGSSPGLPANLLESMRGFTPAAASPLSRLRVDVSKKLITAASSHPFDRRHRGNGIRAAAVHPGGIQTELDRHLDPVHVKKAIEQMNKQLASEGKAPFQLKTIPQGAATSVWLL
jgi:hypothetical protein